MQLSCSQATSHNYFGGLLATRFEVSRYVEKEGREKVLSAKPEQTFDDLGPKVTVWNVKTDQGAWWVVEGDGVPMNLYSQDAYYFSSDEAYSFHMGLMARVLKHEDHDPQHVLKLVSFGYARFAGVRRKLHIASEALASASEAEDYQGIGLLCREALIALAAELVLDSELPEDADPLKLGDFKNRASLAINRLLPEPRDSDLRSHLRKVSQAAWDFAASLTHSPGRTVIDAVICLNLAGATITIFEELLEKEADEKQEADCPVCRSRRLEIIDRQTSEDSPVEKLLYCEYCGWNTVVDTYSLDDQDIQENEAKDAT